MTLDYAISPPFPSPPHLAIIHSLDDGALVALIEGIQRRHIFLLNLKIKHLGIALNVLGIVALGQRYPVLLQRIADQDLRRGFFVFLRQ